MNLLRNIFLRLADTGHNVTIFESNDRLKASIFGHGIKAVHIHIPTPENIRRDVGKSIWSRCPGGVIIPLVYYFGDMALDLMLNNHSDVVLFWILFIEIVEK